jgi:hypothetical protein
VLEVVVSLLLWPAIGLIAYSIGPDPVWRIRSRALWLHVVGGALMLVPLAWTYIKAGREADEERARRDRRRRHGRRGRRGTGPA